MKIQKSNIAYNLATLRQLNKFSQEEVAERIGVSRQAVAKWEAGQSVPDILNCDALAKLYDVDLNDLIHHDAEQTHVNIGPKGKHIFGTVRVGERGQIVLPKQAREVFNIKPGDRFVILGDESPEHPNKVSGVFVPAVIAISIVTMIVWIIVGKDAGFVLARGISVLVISLSLIHICKGRHRTYNH